MSRRIVDLTLPIRAHFRWRVERSRTGDFARGDIFEITQLRFPVHAFTHMDSPRHFVPDGPTTSDIPLSATIGEAAVIDLADVGPMTAIESGRLAERAGHVRRGDIVLLRTGWYARRSIDDPAFWLEAPWLERDAAVWLRDRGVRACGFDFPQDYTIRFLLAGEVRPREEHVTHFELLAHGVILIEYLTNTLQLVSPRVEFFALPLFVPDADGAPVRAIAWEAEGSA
ncbi:Kynurenine formamidase [bacterium HR40]|nr:Kynurenine formamidase [bacterium HR40]